MEYGQGITLGTQVELSPHLALFKKGYCLGVVVAVSGGVCTVRLFKRNKLEIMKTSDLRSVAGALFGVTVVL